MNLKGKVVKVLETETISDKFSKRELWLEIMDGQYPQTISIEFVNQKTTDLDKIGEGDEVEVSVNLRGRIHKDKCYNTIQGWKIIGLAAAPIKETADSIGPIDDLPF